MDNALTEAMVSYYYMTDAADKAYETFSKIGANDDLLKEDEEKRRKIKEDEIKAAEEAKKKEEAAAAAASKRKDAAEKLKEIDEKYNQEIANAEDDLLNGYLSFSEYTKKLAEAAKKAYESLRDETGAKGSDNKYYDTRRQAEHDAALTTKISGKGTPSVTGKAEVMGKKALEQSDGIKIKVHPIIDMEEYKTSWKDVFTDVDTIEGMVTTFENLGQALNTVENSFETLGDSNKSFIEKFQALTKIFGGIYDAINNLISMYELLGDSELAMLIKEKLAVGVKKKLKREEVVANKANAISGAAAAMASIPYVGPVLAAAAAESLAALLEATVPKFAKGGIIQGGSKYGDKLLARVNAGEAVLTQAQQKRFMDMANGKYSGGGQVSFHISGKDLVGVIKNNNAATSRISGQKGF